MRGTRAALAATLGAAALAVTACTAHAVDPQNGGDGSGYVSSDGSIHFVTAAADRVPAPAIEGQTLDGASYDIGNDVGHVLVVNFWGSWCPPCRAEQATLNQVYAATRAKGVRFLGVDVRDDNAAARAFERRQHVGYPSIVDGDDQIPLMFDPRLPDTPPTTVVIDKQGRVAARIFGTSEQGVLQPIIEQLAREPVGGTS